MIDKVNDFKNFTPEMIEQYNQALRNFYNELYEINVVEGTYKIIYHTQNQYFTLIEHGLIEEGIKQATRKFIHPNDKERFLRFVSLENARKCLAKGKPFLSTELRKLWHDGTYHWVSLVMFPIVSDERMESYICFVTDIDQQVNMQMHYLQEKQYQDVIIADAILCAEFDLTSNSIREIAPRILKSLQLSSTSTFSEVIDAVAKQFVYPSDQEMFLRNLDLQTLALASNENNYTLSFEYRNFNLQSKKYFWASSFAHLIYDCNTGHLCCRWYVKDIDRRKQYELGLQDKAEHDQLTGVYNRITFEMIVEDHLAKMDKAAALIILDIDDFKWINDSFGHVYGDNVLKQIAAMIKSTIEDSGIIGRLGGDEFAIFISPMVSREDVLQRMNHICKRMAYAVDFGDDNFSLSCSLGVAFSATDGNTFTDLYRCADEAQYQAKKNGKNQWRVYDQSLITELKKKKNRRIEGIYGNANDFNNLLPNIVFENGLNIDTLNILLDCVARHYEIDNLMIVDLEKSDIITQWIAKGNKGAMLLGYDYFIGEASLRRLQKGETWICNDTAEVEDSYANKSVKAEFAVPIQYNGKARAAVIFSFSKHRHVWTYEEMEAGQRVAKLTSSILENLSLKNSSEIANQLADTLEKLRISEERFHIALDKTNVYIWEFDLIKREFLNSTKTVEYYGSDLIIQDAPYAVIERGFIHPDTVQDYLDIHQKLYNGEKTATCMIQARNLQGEYIWHRITYTNIFDEFGDPIKAIGISEDINAQKQLEIRYEEEEKYHLALMEDMVACHKYNLTRNCIYKNTNRLIGEMEELPITYQEGFKEAAARFVDAEEKQEFLASFNYEYLLKEFHAGNHSHTIEYRRADDAGKIIWVLAKVNLMRHSKNDEIYAFIYIKDIDRKKKQELSLKERAEKDDLTGMYNRRTMESMLESMTKNPLKKSNCSAFVLIDISNLKAVHDLYGHVYSQQLIKEITEVVMRSFPANAVIARVANDEFVIFCEKIELKALFIHKVKEFCSCFDKEFFVKDINIEITVAVGVVFSTMQDIKYEYIEKEAEIAVRSAKLIHKNNYFVHDHTQFNEYEADIDTGNETAAVYDADTHLLLEQTADLTNKRMQQDLQEEKKLLNTYDKMTGLLGRSNYLEYLKNTYQESLSSLGVVSADVNGLKKLNQKCGHEIGDKLIIFTAETLKRNFAGANLYRLTGDEFLVLYEDITYDAFIECVKNAKHDIAANHPDSIAIGYTWADKDIHIERMVQHADEFMVIAKHRYYQESNNPNKRYAAEAVDKLLEEIKNGEYVMYLQPKAETYTGKIVGAEALVRKINKNQEIIAPIQFIPMLEANKLIHYIDLFIFEEVCKTLSSWQQSGKQVIPISLNFSRVTMLEEHIIEDMLKIMDRYSIEKEFIEIEITESIGEMEQEIVADIGEKFSAQGFKLSIDDFGAKYSNLSILALMRFDVLKLDKTMINDLVSNERMRVIVKNFLDTCRTLNIKTVAEGVEKESQLEILKKLGCDLIQGYFIDKPISLVDFQEKYISRN